MCSDDVPDLGAAPLTAVEASRALAEGSVSAQALVETSLARIASLPDPALDIDDDDPDDAPVPIKGEPLSETIIRERR